MHKLKKNAAATGTPAPAHDPNDIAFAYKSPQALGKAVHKLTPLLPKAQEKERRLYQNLPNLVVYHSQITPSIHLVVIRK